MTRGRGRQGKKHIPSRSKKKNKNKNSFAGADGQKPEKEKLQEEFRDWERQDRAKNGPNQAPIRPGRLGENAEPGKLIRAYPTSAQSQQNQKRGRGQGGRGASQGQNRQGPRGARNQQQSQQGNDQGQHRGPHRDQDLPQGQNARRGRNPNRDFGGREESSDKFSNLRARPQPFNEDRRQNTNDRRHDRNEDFDSPIQNPGKEFVDGKIDIHPDGFGFLIPRDHSQPNIYVGEESLKSVMHKDEVRVRIEKAKFGSKSRGHIVAVLKRHQKELLGTLRFFGGGNCLVIPLEIRDRRHSFKVQNLDEKFKNLKSGTPILCKVLQYPDMGPGLVELVQVLEDPDLPSNDTLRVLLQASWPREFSKEAVTEAEDRSKNWKKDLPSQTRDIRKLPLVTIDGRDARDFDDAVCAKKEGAGFRLWVAIADVSLFVRTGTRLDEEALERSTSVYFPDHVVPMLPEVLSNGVCSLNPNEDRACLVCEMFVTKQGKIRDFEFYEGLMKSQKRLTYEQMQAFLEKEKWALEEMHSLTDSLEAIIQTFHVLLSAKVRRGAIDLDIPEAFVQLNKDGTVRDIVTRERLDAHRLIEECMLAANECAAKFIKEKCDEGIYRIHEKPDEKKIQALQSFLDLFGIQDHSELNGPEDFSRLTRHLKEEFEVGDPTPKAIQTLILRSLKQARYATDPVGHFALALEDYTHFTSPIRRYPDLIVHRLIKSALNIEKFSLKLGRDLAAVAQHNSDQERSAMDAERKLIDIKKCRYMEKHLGEEFDAFVTGVTEKGLFCTIEDHFVDGLATADTLASRLKVRFEAELMSYVGPAKMRLTLGTKLRVLLAAVSVETRRIDFDVIKVY